MANNWKRCSYPWRWRWPADYLLKAADPITLTTGHCWTSIVLQKVHFQKIASPSRAWRASKIVSDWLHSECSRQSTLHGIWNNWCLTPDSPQFSSCIKYCKLHHKMLWNWQMHRNVKNSLFNVCSAKAINQLTQSLWWCGCLATYNPPPHVTLPPLISGLINQRAGSQSADSVRTCSRSTFSCNQPNLW